MEIIELEHIISIKSTDENGEFVFNIVTPTIGLCQIQIESDDDEVAINVDLKELRAIRNALTKTIKKLEEEG